MSGGISFKKEKTMKTIADEIILNYSRKNWEVIPIKENSKIPATNNGYKNHTKNPNLIKNWFKNQNYNVAVVAGSVSGVLVLDIDPRNSGDESLEKLEKKLGKLPETLVQLTPSGGFHYIFKYNEKLKKCVVDQGIDLLTDGGYFLVSPSKIGNKSYEWELSSESLQIAELPKSWVSYILKLKEEKKPLISEKLLDGNRNIGLFSLGSSLRKIGLTSNEIFSCLKAVNQERCESSLSDEEIRKIAQNSGNYKQEVDIVSDSVLGASAIENLLAKRKSGFYLENGNEILKSKVVAEWTLENFIPENSVCMLYGNSSSGKTFIALDMALCLATGKNWNGNNVKKGNVIYLCGEANSGIGKRLKAWSLHNKQTDLSNFNLSSCALDLDQKDGLKEVEKSIEKIKGGISVIFIDTLNNHFSGDENSSRDSRNFINACNYLSRKFNCSVVINHHTGHTSTRARGSSAWKANLDSIFFVKKRGDTIEIQNTKQKDYVCSPTINLNLKKIGESAVVVSESCDDNLGKYKRIFLTVWEIEKKMRDGKPFVSRNTMKEFLKEKGLSDRTIQNMLSTNYSGKMVGLLKNNNFLQKVQGGWICNTN
jgi:hypothetical protein